MNRLILCEGKTDAILLSYYLGKICGWTYTSKQPKDLLIKEDNLNESISWYEKDGERLLICGVGGKSNFGNFFAREIVNPLVKANAFEKIAIVVDRDNQSAEEIEQNLSDELDHFFSSIKNQMWTHCEYIDSFGLAQHIEFLLVSIPINQQGALETVLLEAISEDEYDKNIVEKSKQFVSSIRPQADKYIKSDRLQLKADLSVTWAIQSPEKVFDFIDEQIRNAQWEKSKTLRTCFNELEKI